MAGNTGIALFHGDSNAFRTEPRAVAQPMATDGSFPCFLAAQFGAERLAGPTRLGRAVACTGRFALVRQPSSKVVTPKTRSCARVGAGPRYILAQPKTSTIRRPRASSSPAGLF